MLPWCSCASVTLDVLKGRFCNAATMAKDFKLRFICTFDDATAIVLPPKCRRCAGATLVFVFENRFYVNRRAEVEVQHQMTTNL